MWNPTSICAVSACKGNPRAGNIVLDLVLYLGSCYSVQRSILLTTKLTMLHRVLSLLLIGTTLLGPVVCCCSLKSVSAAPAESQCCCCRQDDSEESCPTNSDGEKEHDCPCREHRTFRARLNDSQILPTSPSTIWTIELLKICSVVFYLSADEVSPQRNRLPPCRLDSMPTGSEILIAQCVRRC